MNARVGAERQLHAELHRLAKVLALRLGDLAVLAQEFFQLAAFRPFRLRVVAVVDVHRQVDAALPRELQSFVVDQARMLDGVDAGANRRRSAFAPCACTATLLPDMCASSISACISWKRVLLRTGRIALGEHAAGAAELDDVHAVLRCADVQFSRRRSVGSAVAGFFVFRSKQIGIAVSAGAERRTGNQHARPGISPSLIASRTATSLTRRTHVANGRDTGEQSPLRVRGAL